MSLCVLCVFSTPPEVLHVHVCCTYMYMYMCMYLYRILHVITLLKRWSVNLASVYNKHIICSISMKIIYYVRKINLLCICACNEENHAGVSYPTMSYVCMCPNPQMLS